jgi:hypothetical protein
MLFIQMKTMQNDIAKNLVPQLKIRPAHVMMTQNAS